MFCFICACFLLTTENAKPSMLELNRFVVYVHARKWRDIGLELGLEFDVLNEIEVNSNHDNMHCFRRALNMWLKETQYPSWSELEVAITNVNRTESGLLPVVSVYGKDLIIDTYNILHGVHTNIKYVYTVMKL